MRERRLGPCRHDQDREVDEEEAPLPGEAHVLGLDDGRGKGLGGVRGGHPVEHHTELVAQDRPRHLHEDADVVGEQVRPDVGTAFQFRRDGVDDLPAGGGQGVRCTVHPVDRRGVQVDPGHLADHRCPSGGRRALEWNRHRSGVAGVASVEYPECRAQVGHGPSHRAVRQHHLGRERRVLVVFEHAERREAPVAGLERRDPAAEGRIPDRTSDVVAEAQR